MHFESPTQSRCSKKYDLAIFEIFRERSVRKSFGKGQFIQGLINLNSSLLIPPYGEHLVDLMVPAQELEALKTYAGRLPSVQISERSLCDLQLLASGAFSPLDRFAGELDHQRILDEMRLSSGHIFPIPVTLPVNRSPDLRLDHDIALRSSKNELL